MGQEVTFKVGDTVVCIDRQEEGVSKQLQVGQQYTIIEIMTYYCWVAPLNEDAFNNHFLCDRFISLAEHLRRTEMDKVI